jgi:alkyl sulfatase BDS1-like metallo-beta-lactamase superfamily hydrolase
VIELSNATLTNIEGYEAEDADLSITINRADLEQTMMGVKPLMAQFEDGTASSVGDLGVLKQLASAMIEFDLFFEVLPGTKGPSTASDLNDFEVGPISEPHE